LYVGFENAAFRFVGTYWKYFRVEGKDSSTKEFIHDGRTWKRKRVPCIAVGDRKTDEVRYLKDFIMDDGCQYFE